MAKPATRVDPVPPAPATMPAMPAKAAGRGVVAFKGGTGGAKKRRRSITFGRVINGKGLAVLPGSSPRS